MQHDDNFSPYAPPSPPWWKSISGLVMCGFLLVASFYLLTEHTAHLWGVLPFLLLIACPLMHLFHHHGHGKHPAGPLPGSRALAIKVDE
jgi:hypothetical protein